MLPPSGRATFEENCETASNAFARPVRSGLQVTEENAHRVGLAIGSGIGGLPSIEKHHEILLESGPRRVSPFFIPGALINMVAGNLSIQYGMKGPNIALVSACTTGTHNIGLAARSIVHGDADVAHAGGVTDTQVIIRPERDAGNRRHFFFFQQPCAKVRGREAGLGGPDADSAADVDAAAGDLRAGGGVVGHLVGELGGHRVAGVDEPAGAAEPRF